MADPVLSVVRPAQYRVPLKSLTEGLSVFKVEYTFSDSYTTGGDPFNAIPAGQEIEIIQMHGVRGYTFSYDFDAQTMQAFTTADTEVAAATDLSALGVIPGLAWVVHR